MLVGQYFSFLSCCGAAYEEAKSATDLSDHKTLVEISKLAYWAASKGKVHPDDQKMNQLDDALDLAAFQEHLDKPASSDFAPFEIEKLEPKALLEKLTNQGCENWSNGDPSSKNKVPYFFFAITTLIKADLTSKQRRQEGVSFFRRLVELDSSRYTTFDQAKHSYIYT